VKKTILAAGLASLLSTGAMAQTIGVSMALFDDNFLTVLRNGMIDYARSLDGVQIQVEDARNDVGRQLNQIQNFIASGVDAIIVNPVDTDATVAMTRAAADAGIPLVFVNRQPVNVDELPPNQAFIASNEIEAGTLQGQEVCRLLREQGKADGATAVLLMGELANQAARARTEGVKNVIATPECAFITIEAEQTGNWMRTQGQDIVTNWLSAGIAFDAIFSNNDEMAIGAIQALRSAGIDPQPIVIGGSDATRDALAAMRAGDLDVTVFQDARGQGQGAVDAALALVRGQSVEQKVYIPYALVTPENIAAFEGVN
jgi:inositol transport system substrate-binding protein